MRSGVGGVDKLDMIQAMQVLDLEPGDTLVIKTHLVLSTEQNARLRQHVIAIVGDVPVLVLDNGTDVGILRRAA
jgi:hypothetical protein